jgi:hypothetical protein
MKGSSKVLGLGTALVCVALVGTTPAAAKTTTQGARASNAASGKVGLAAGPALNTAGTPSNYKVVAAGFTAPNGVQSFGTVACPVSRRGVQTYPLSGGVVIGSDSVLANINATYPSGTNWDAYVNNNSGAITDFSVYAVCATPPKGYQVVESSGNANPAGSQDGAGAVCPRHTEVTGGGILLSSTDLGTNVNATFPDGANSNDDGWTGLANNDSAAAETFDVYAVCGKINVTKKHYSVQVSSDVDNPSGAETFVDVACPAGIPVLGGGVLASSFDLTVDVNTTVPDGTSAWEAYVNNGSPDDDTVSAYAICAT